MIVDCCGPLYRELCECLGVHMFGELGGQQLLHDVAPVQDLAAAGAARTSRLTTGTGRQGGLQHFAETFLLFSIFLNFFIRLASTGCALVIMFQIFVFVLKLIIIKALRPDI